MRNITSWLGVGRFGAWRDVLSAGAGEAALDPCLDIVDKVGGVMVVGVDVWLDGVGGLELRAQ